MLVAIFAENPHVLQKTPTKTAHIATPARNIAFPSFAHLSNNRAYIIFLQKKIGQFPTSDGLFEQPRLAYFGGSQLSLTSVGP
jgi:hypothetical protein